MDKDAFKVEWWRPAFTRRREIFMARTAMAGFLSLQVGEASLNPLSTHGFRAAMSSSTVALMARCSCSRHTAAPWLIDPLGVMSRHEFG